MASSWSELLTELFNSILERLPFVDQVRLSCVCVSWRSLVRSNLVVPAPRLPWLILAQGTKFRSSLGNGRQKVTRKRKRNLKTTLDFLGLSENRVYKIPLHDPSLINRMHIGSSMGWLITADERSELHLWNPITGSQISLPSVATLPHVEPLSTSGVKRYAVGELNRMVFNANDLRYYLYVKAIFAPSSESSGDYTVVLIRNPYRQLAFAKVGDDSWKTMSEATSYDVIYHKGKFYTLDCSGYVKGWDLSGPLPKLTFRAPKCEDVVFCRSNYLVESSSGDLLHIHISGCVPLYYMMKFQVFKLDLTQNAWVHVQRLDNEACSWAVVTLHLSPTSLG